MTNILLPEAGGIGALNIIKCLKDISNIKLIATDSNKNSPGLYFSDKYYIVPETQNPNYIPIILQICENEHIDIIFPSYDSLIPFYSKNKMIFEKYKIKLAVNDYDTIMIASDKLLTYKKLNNKVAMAITYTYEELKNQNNNTLFPLVMKPRIASGSKDLHILENFMDYKYFIDKYKTCIDDFIFQEYLKGDEYTVDLFCDLEGNLLCAIPRARLQIKAGVSYKGITVNDPKIISIANEITKSIKLIGPTCFQIIKNSDNQIKLFEINPRICGTMAFSKKAGVNLPLLTIKLYTGQEIKENELKFKHGVLMLRYWEEFYLQDIELAENMSKDKRGDLYS